MSARPGTRASLIRTAASVVGLAVVAASTVAMVSVGTADANTRSTHARSSTVARSLAASPTSPNQVTARAPFTKALSNGRVLIGSYKPGAFKVNDAGDLRVRGSVRAVIRRADGSFSSVGTQKKIWATVQQPIGWHHSGAATKQRAAAAAFACPVLNLVLGPLDLDLLGLQVHLDQVVLNIIAQSGAGKLLGNLLCAVAGLLDSAGPLSGVLTQISDLLNSILAILRA
jgi:hypothetical protein